MPTSDGASRCEAKTALVETFETFGGGALRDVWLFDRTDHESLFLREDVSEKLAGFDVERYVDNERYGFVTRDTYGDLHYADYEYTVRGFDGFEQFRTFLSVDEEKIGVFASFDRRDIGYDFGALYRDIQSVVGDYAVESFLPG
ncbi:DUF7522 family protein [Halorussus marinus]|uniref:DUF7522 family protein n=1 Tax=Halorussus marinus TaxID=2505976 RepID=UPI00106EF846|nr:hypothetical protein [Halorussus marinus]